VDNIIGKDMYIYKITNKLNNKIYIGKSTDGRKHKKLSYYGSGLLIGRAIEKYGIGNFTKEIIDECSNNDELCDRETYWILHYNSTDRLVGYNITAGGDGGDTMSNHPEISIIKEKISNTLKGRVFTEEHRENLRKNHPFKKEEHRIKHSRSLKGKAKSEHHRASLSKATKKAYENGFLSIFQTNNPMVVNKYIWITNGITGENKRIIEGSSLPDGFVYGRSHYKKTYVECKTCGRVMVNTCIKRHERLCSVGVEVV
jgi:group I intron endonuclease